MRELVCDSCGAQRNELVPAQSVLLNTMTFNLCNDCKEAGKEPRWLIILVAREGRDVTHWIAERLYEGEVISPELLSRLS